MSAPCVRAEAAQLGRGACDGFRGWGCWGGCAVHGDSVDGCWRILGGTTERHLLRDVGLIAEVVWAVADSLE